MYVLVYAPDGEPFEVTRDRADRLILQEGWTQSAPVKTENTVVVESVPVEKATSKVTPSKGTRD